MSRMQIAGVIFVVMAMVLPVACSPQAAPAPIATPQASSPTKAAQPTATATKAPSRVSDAEWERTVEAAKAEGSVVLVTAAGDEARRALAAGFKNAYGINLETIFGQDSARILAERRAGLNFTDSVIFGSSTIVNDLKANGVLDSLEPVLVLPELTDPTLIARTWYGGKLPWVDNDHMMFMGLLYPAAPIAINTNLVKASDVQSLRDLLNPKWKGQMILNDPTIVGFSGSNFMPMIILGGVAGGADWLRDLVKNEPVVMRDQRMMLDWLAHGKVAIVIAPKPDTALEFIRANAPIATITPKEGTVLSGSASVVVVTKGRPHPNATKLFVNWYLSKEGQTVFSRGYGGQSAREDVPTDFLPPQQLRQPGTTYFIKDEEEKLKKGPEVFKTAKEILAPLMK